MSWTIQYMICGLRILVRGEMYYMTLIVMKLDLLQVVLVVDQVHGVLEDLLIAGRRLLAWGGGDYLHGALLEVLGLFPHLEDGEEDLQGSGDHQEEDHLELPGHPHRMEQTNRYSLDNTEKCNISEFAAGGQQPGENPLDVCSASPSTPELDIRDSCKTICPRSLLQAWTYCPCHVQARFINEGL